MINDGYDNLCRLVVRLGKYQNNDRNVFHGCVEYLGLLDVEDNKADHENQTKNQKK